MNLNEMDCEVFFERLWDSPRLRKVLIVCSLAGAVLCFLAEQGLRMAIASPQLWDMAMSFVSAYVRDMTNLQEKLFLKMDGLASLMFFGQLFCIFLLCCLFAKRIAAALENPKYARIVTICAWGVTAALLCYVTVFSYLYGKQWANSDTASDGVLLGKVLAEENAFITRKWYYSTELRLIFQSLFTMPLFKLFGWTENWALIRAINIFLNNAALVFAYTFMLGQLKIKRIWTALTAPLLLFALGATTGDSYWWISVFGGVYVFFLIQMFVCLGFFFHLASHNAVTRKWKTYCVLFSLLSFVLGVQGIRALLVIQIPLFIALLFEFAVHNSEKKKAPIMLAAWSLLLSGIGYAVFNSLILKMVYYYSDLGRVMLDGRVYVDFFSRIGRILLTAAQFFGFDTDVVILSGQGMLSIASLVFTVLLFYGAIKAVLPTGKTMRGGGEHSICSHAVPDDSASLFSLHHGIQFCRICLFRFWFYFKILHSIADTFHSAYRPVF